MQTLIYMMVCLHMHFGLLVRYSGSSCLHSLIIAEPVKSARGVNMCGLCAEEADMAPLSLEDHGNPSSGSSIKGCAAACRKLSFGRHLPPCYLWAPVSPPSASPSPASPSSLCVGHQYGRRLS